MIKASSDKVKGKIDPGSNQFAFTVQIKSFRGFNTALQREHFNDNYLQSDRYPSANFSGKIIEQIDFSTDGTYDVRAKGNLDIHGQKQTRIIRSKMVIHGGSVTIESSFFVPLADHNISIPKIVNQKIATEIEVSFNATLTSE
jgi:YceI-like domain